MKKKGQIVIFIVISIVILFVLFIYYFVNVKNSINRPIEDDFYDSVDSCINSFSNDGLNYIGLQGGYDNVNVPKENYSILDIPIYWNVNKDLSPDKNKVELELSNFLKRNIPICLNKTGSDFVVDLKNVVITPIINNNSVNIKIKYPISVKNGETVKKYEDFSQNIDSKIGLAIALSKNIMSEQKKDINKFPIGYVTDLSNRNKIYFETIPINKNELMTNLVFDKEGENPFVFAFINKYDWEKL